VPASSKPETAEREHYRHWETDMVKIGNGVWKLDGTSELAHVLEEFLAERMPINVKLDEAMRLPGVIFAGQVVCDDAASGDPEKALNLNR
jgi:hypothetical protein